ncbi:MAG: YkgJ family cysteine cluster protein [Candidatus Sericytochromatia bacterium]|nr:YkgJ family cysteine cluster protein [Candidatus Sericytochromatia bacterium]
MSVSADGAITCVACGACCVAPDISTLCKPLGQPCRHLGADQLCRIYDDRPPVCRNYQPDAICLEVAPLPTLEARVARYLAIYGLADAATGSTL